MKNLNRFNSSSPEENEMFMAHFDAMAESAHAFATGKAAKPAKRDAWKGHDRRNARRAAIAGKRAFLEFDATLNDE